MSKINLPIAHPPEGEAIYSEPRFELRLCQVPLSDGAAESRGLMIHPGAVVLVPILEDGRIVMIHNRRWQVGQILLELPAGTREAGEEPARCARRELREETGYTTDNLRPLPAFFAAPGVSTEVMHPYVATGLTYVGQSLAPDESIEIVPMTQASLKSALIDGQVIDGKTLAVLGRYFLSKS
jgi:ADP-ribose pyrophosphatase